MYSIIKILQIIILLLHEKSETGVSRFPNSIGFVLGYTIHPETNEIRGKEGSIAFFQLSYNRLARLLILYHMEKKKQIIT